MAEYTLESISEILKIDKDKIRRRLNRNGISSAGNFDSITLKEIATTYSKPRSGRSNKTIEAAQDILLDLQNTMPVSISDPAPTKEKKTIPLKEKTTKTIKKIEVKTGIENMFSGQTFLFTVFTSALLWQMVHSTSLVMRISLIENDHLKLAAGVLFAFSVQFTALLMTIHTGNNNYLKGFAFVEVLINVLYYQPWNGDVTLTYWLTSLTISGAIAFTIYSYSDLFSKKDK